MNQETACELRKTYMVIGQNTDAKIYWLEMDLLKLDIASAIEKTQTASKKAGVTDHHISLSDHYVLSL